jgi:hypothetical protein
MPAINFPHMASKKTTILSQKRRFYSFLEYNKDKNRLGYGERTNNFNRQEFKPKEYNRKAVLSMSLPLQGGIQPAHKDQRRQPRRYSTKELALRYYMEAV